MKKIYWLICNFEKYKKLTLEDLKECSQMAENSGFEIEFAYVSKINYCNEEKAEEIKKMAKPFKNFRMMIYGKNHTENECIFNALSFVSADRYFVCDERYLEHKKVIEEMLELSSYYQMHFVRCKKDYDGIFATPVHFVKRMHNKILGLITNSKNENYVRNFVIFSEEVMQYVRERPISSANIRETDMLFNANTEVVPVPRSFKKAKHRVENWTSYLIGSASAVLCLWCIVSMFVLRTDLDIFTWLLVGIIVFGIIALLSLNFAIANSKTVFYRPFWKREECRPVWEHKRAKKRIANKKAEEKE